MPFQKGHKINVGRVLTEEHKRKLLAYSLNSHNPVSDETKRKISEATKGRVFTEEHKRKISLSNKGRKLTPEQRLKYSLVKLGNKHWNWKGGITPITKSIRSSFEYKLWRKSVFERDNYTCIWCGDNRGGNLEADHIKPFALFPELRFAIDNGRTLCHSCHQKTDTYGCQKMYQ